MKRILSLLITLSLTSALPALAGTLKGTVSGAWGTSVVYVDAIPGRTFPAPAQKFVIDQKSMQFVPNLLVVPVGATVAFENHDAVPHNVFWPSVAGNKKLGHNLGTFASGKAASYQFTHPGVVPLFCSIHPNMSGYIVVSPTPYFATTGLMGDYTISDIPNGHYRVTAWHADKKPVTKEVSVAGDATLDFSLSQ
jgi:plastocyanin